MKKKILFIIIAIFGVSFLALGAYCVRRILIFEVWDLRNSRVLVRVFFQPDDTFSLQSIHSVQLTPYTHIFKVDAEGNIVLSQAVFESEGAGFPVYGDGTLSIVDGKFHMDQMNRFIGVLRFRVSPVSKETLCVSNAELPLYKLVPEGTSIEIKVSKAWVWSFQHWKFPGIKR
jgi:hypothetical protein